MNNFEGQIACSTYSWAERVGNAGAGGTGTGGPGIAVVDPVTVSYPNDMSSPSVMASCAEGQTLPNAILTFQDRKSGQAIYILELENVHIIAMAINQSADGNPPTINIELTGSKFLWTYNVLDANGSVIAVIKHEYNFATSQGN